MSDAAVDEPIIGQTPAVLTATTGALTFAAATALFPSAIAPEIAHALGVSPALIGVQVSLLYAGAMLSSLIGGGITRRIGACRTTQWAVGLFGLGGVVATLPNVWMFILASLLIGLGYGLTNPAASHLLTRFSNPARRGLVFGFKQTGVPLGGVVAGALAPTLTVLFNWQVALALLLVPALTGIGLLQIRRPQWDDDRSASAPWLASPMADIRLVWAHRPLRWTALASFFFSITQLCLTVFTVTMLVEDLAIALVTAGLMMAAVQVCGVGGRILWGYVADRLGQGLLTIAITQTMTSALALSVTLMRPEWPIFLITALLCLFSLGALGWNGVYLAQIAHLAPAGQVARASGGALFITFAGVLFGPAAFSALHLITPTYLSTFAAVAAMNIIGVGFVLIARSHARQAALAQ